MRDYKIIAAIGDVHIGNRVVSAESLKKQLRKHFLDVIEKMDPLDGIFVLGDLSHTILSLNSDYANLYLWFVDRVYRIAKKKNACVVIVKGTISHDNDQLNNIRHYQNNEDGVDFRIYETVEEITLWDDYRVLVLPDVKVKKLRDVGRYLEKPDAYDMIIGHGLIDRMQFFVQESENMPTKTYVYKVDDLMRASRGPILFGHIHQLTAIHDKFYYSGPFTLLERGGRSAGFLVVGIYNRDRSKFVVEHYPNPDTADFIEMNVTEDMLRDIPIDDIISAVDDIIADCKDNDLITLRITRGDEKESVDRVLMLEGRYRRDRRISIVKKIKNRREEEKERTQREHREKYAYLLDKDTPLPSIMYQYYLADVKPTIPDQRSREANLVEEDFIKALEK